MYHLRLTWNYMKQKKSRTICSIMGILLTIILSFSVLTAGYSFLDYALEITYLNNGHTQLFTTDAVTKEQFTQICNYANVEHVLLYDQNGNQCTEISANSKDEVFDMFIGLKDTSDLYKSAEQLSAHTGLSIFADETVALDRKSVV